jgi:hypothetical protein
MRFGSWLEIHLAPRRPGNLNRFLEVLSDVVELLFASANFRSLPLQLGQIFPTSGQQHPRKTGLVNSGIRDAYVVPHELGDHEFRFEQVSERQRINVVWPQHCQASRANRAILMWPDDADCSAFWSHR